MRTSNPIDTGVDVADDLIEDRDAGDSRVGSELVGEDPCLSGEAIGRRQELSPSSGGGQTRGDGEALPMTREDLGESVSAPDLHGHAIGVVAVDSRAE